MSGHGLLEFQNQASQLQREADSWQVQQDETCEEVSRSENLVRQIEEFVIQTLAMSKQLGHLLTANYGLVAANVVRDYQATGKIVARGFELAFIALDAVRDCVLTATRMGYEVKRANELGLAEAEMKKLKNHFDAHWPWIRENMLVDSMAAYQRGDSRTIKDILNGLRDTNPQAG